MTTRRGEDGPHPEEARSAVSKDGRESVCCIHPSRRHAEPVIGRAFARPVGMAPPAITAKPLRGDEVGAWFRARNLPDGQITSPCADRVSSPSVKNILIFRNAKSLVYSQPSRPTRGAYRDRHGRGTGCGGRGWRFGRERVKRTAKSCGPDASTLASSSREAILAGDGGKRARSPRRARSKP